MNFNTTKKQLTDQEFGRQYGSTLGMCINIVAEKTVNKAYLDTDDFDADVLRFFRRVLNIQQKAKEIID